MDRLDSYRVDNLDRQVIKAITDTFGKGIWQRGLVVLTHAQLSPPDGLDYDDYLAKRSKALMKYVRLGARIKKQEFQVNLSILRFFLSSYLSVCHSRNFPILY